MSATEFLLKMAADTAGTPVDLINALGTTPVNAGRNFAAVLKGEKIPEPKKKLIETGSSEDLRKRAGVGTEDSLKEIAGMLAAPTIAGKIKALPLIAMAFRNSGDSAISRNMLELLKAGKTEKGLDQARRQDEHFASSDLVLQTVASKLSDKELKKYGTAEFILDKYLPSTKNAERLGSDPTPNGTFRVDDGYLREDKEHILRMNSARANNIRNGAADIEVLQGPEAGKSMDAYLAKMQRDSESTKIVEDFLDAKKTGKTLYDADDTYAMKNEIGKGLRDIVGNARDLGIPEEDIAKKSLEQLTSVIKKKEDDALKLLKKNAEVKNGKFRERTTELMQSQKEEKLPDGFVKLVEPEDLSHETDMMNHCVGAVCRDNDKYIPMHDAVTGGLTKQGQRVIDTGNYGSTSFNKYNNARGDGTSEFFSYRPDGLAEFTVEIGVDKDGKRYLKQAFGPEDAELTTQQKLRLEKLLDNKEVDRNLDEFGGQWEAEDEQF